MLRLGLLVLILKYSSLYLPLHSSQQGEKEKAICCSCLYAVGSQGLQTEPAGLGKKVEGMRDKLSSKRWFVEKLIVVRIGTRFRSANSWDGG